MTRQTPLRPILCSLSLLLAASAAGAALTLSDPAFVATTAAAPVAVPGIVLANWAGDTNGFTVTEFETGRWRVEFDVLGNEARTVTVSVSGVNGAEFNLAAGMVNWTFAVGDIWLIEASAANTGDTAELLIGQMEGPAEEAIAWSALEWTPETDSDTLTFTLNFTPLAGSTMWFSFTLEIAPLE